jgi:hypothetical protein
MGFIEKVNCIISTTPFLFKVFKNGLTSEETINDIEKSVFELFDDYTNLPISRLREFFQLVFETLNKNGLIGAGSVSEFLKIVESFLRILETFFKIALVILTLLFKILCSIYIFILYIFPFILAFLSKIKDIVLILIKKGFFPALNYKFLNKTRLEAINLKSSDEKVSKVFEKVKQQNKSNFICIVFYFQFFFQFFFSNQCFIIKR